MPDVTSELTRGGINLAVTLVVLGAGWLIGQRLTYQWNLRQKRRESDLATAQDLQRLYGDFFAVWKEWNGVTPDPGPAAKAVEPAAKAALFRRACEGEGLLERVIVKLASERRLSAVDRETVGRFRQGYQRLRRAIRADQRLPWHGSEHPEYLAFKRLGAAVTLIVHREPGRARIGPDEAFAALRDITANRLEEKWAEHN
jgi:hypothetical protein